MKLLAGVLPNPSQVSRAAIGPCGSVLTALGTPLLAGIPTRSAGGQGSPACTRRRGRGEAVGRDSRRVQTAVIGDAESEMPISLPREAIELDRFRAAYAEAPFRSARRPRRGCWGSTSSPCVRAMSVPPSWWTWRLAAWSTCSLAKPSGCPSEGGLSAVPTAADLWRRVRTGQSARVGGLVLGVDEATAQAPLGSLAYRQGIADGAPDALQVSDRFHLWQGLSRRVQVVAAAQ